MMLPAYQTVQVAFRYPVHFTTALFAADNPLLRDTLGAERAPGLPAKALCVVDRGVVESRPDLPAEIEAYFGAFGHPAATGLVRGRRPSPLVRLRRTLPTGRRADERGGPCGAFCARTT